MGRKHYSTRRRISNTQIEYQTLESRNLLAAITVTTLADNGNLSDGLISLREAIVATNTNTAFGDAPAGDVDGDSIRIAPALIGQTVALSSGELEITDDLVIRGFGTTIEAAPGERIFSVSSSEIVTLSRLNLENGESNEGGALRYEGDGTLRLFQSQFSNNTAQFGGAVYAASGNLSVVQSTFNDNTALGDATAGTFSDGGGLYLADQSTTVVILDSTFENNVAENGNGGAISAGESDQIFAFGNTFTNNSARSSDTSHGNGGAIYSEGLIRVGQSTFTGNHVDNGSGSGGAIYGGGDRVVLANTTFDSNSADRLGGAVYLESGIVSQLNNVRFINNEASGESSSSVIPQGGAIYVAPPEFDYFGFPADPDEPASNLTIRSSFFQGNHAMIGGAIFLDGNSGSEALITHTTFVGNFVEQNGDSRFATGGAIHSSADLRIFGSTFNNNEARDDQVRSKGGALHLVDSDVEIARSTFSGNRADFGGAVAFEEFNDFSDVTVFESEFRNNRAGLPAGDPGIPSHVTSPTGDGGAIYLRSTNTFSGTVFQVIGGLFQDNVATDSGGAIAAAAGAAELVISGNANGATQFIGNRALAGDGGAISNTINASIRDAVFSENTARNGGGIFMGIPNFPSNFFFPEELTLLRTEITDNDARLNGGGVFIASPAGFSNSSSNITSNTARIGADIFEE